MNPILYLLSNRKNELFEARQVKSTYLGSRSSREPGPPIRLGGGGEKDLFGPQIKQHYCIIFVLDSYPLVPPPLDAPADRSEICRSYWYEQHTHYQEFRLRIRVCRSDPGILVRSGYIGRIRIQVNWSDPDPGLLVGSGSGFIDRILILVYWSDPGKLVGS